MAFSLNLNLEKRNGCYLAPTIFQRNVANAFDTYISILAGDFNAEVSEIKMEHF